MQRQLLRLTLVLGVLVTLVGGTGLYAVFSDQASTGIFEADSGEVAGAAYLRISAGQLNPGPVTCNPFQDDLTVPLTTMVDIQPSFGSLGAFCLENAGSAPLDVTMMATNLSDIELSCTGDEASVDATCDAGQAGELSHNLLVWLVEVPCASSEPGPGPVSSKLDDLGTTPIALPNGTGLAPGATYCGYWTINYPETPADLVQAAQTDRADWSFTFIGTAQ